MTRARTPGHSAEELRELLGEPDGSRAARGATSAAEASEWVVPAVARAEPRA